MAHYPIVLGMGVSTVVGVLKILLRYCPYYLFPIINLDMAGNVGTQSLAVTIRVLMDEEMDGKDKLSLVIKELKNRIGEWYPAIASGPLITTVNDLIAVVTYYGLSWLFLIQWRHFI